MNQASQGSGLSVRATLDAAARPGILGGLLGAILIDAYRLVLATMSHGTPAIERHYREVAAAVIGSMAFAYPGAAYVGVAIHLIVAITWGVGYAYVAVQRPSVAHRPLVSGLFFGIVVYICMQCISEVAGLPVTFLAPAVFVALVAHTIFFGIPLALVVDARLRAAGR